MTKIFLYEKAVHTTGLWLPKYTTGSNNELGSLKNHNMAKREPNTYRNGASEWIVTQRQLLHVDERANWVLLKTHSSSRLKQKWKKSGSRLMLWCHYKTVWQNTTRAIYHKQNYKQSHLYALTYKNGAGEFVAPEWQREDWRKVAQYVLKRFDQIIKVQIDQDIGLKNSHIIRRETNLK
jgi:hypothetical protein